MSRTYKGFTMLLGEDGRYHACVGRRSMLSTVSLISLKRAIDIRLMSVADARAALAKVLS